MNSARSSSWLQRSRTEPGADRATTPAPVTQLAWCGHSAVAAVELRSATRCRGGSVLEGEPETRDRGDPSAEIDSVVAEALVETGEHRHLARSLVGHRVALALL